MSVTSTPDFYISVDTTDRKKITTLLSLAHKYQGKIGLKFKPELIPYLNIGEALQEFTNVPIFMDCKIHDTPNQAAERMELLLNMHPNIAAINLMAMGGAEMMRACQEELTALCFEGDLLAVTVLTTSKEPDILKIGITGSVERNVLNLATLAEHAGLNGIVCSALEAKMIGQNLSSLKTYCPGIRYPDETIAGDDQKRVTTPYDAIMNGVTYPIIGSPIYKLETVEEMKAMVGRILDDIADAKGKLAA